MSTLIFILIAVVLVWLTIFLQLKQKNVCPNCKSKNISKTGNKVYKESPAIAVLGSPDSYYQIEYKCNGCGKTFYKEQRSAIFN